MEIYTRLEKACVVKLLSLSRSAKRKLLIKARLQRLTNTNEGGWHFNEHFLVV